MLVIDESGKPAYTTAACANIYGHNKRFKQFPSFIQFLQQWHLQVESSLRGRRLLVAGRLLNFIVFSKYVVYFATKQ